MNAAYKLYQEITSERRTLSGAIEFALKNMKNNNSKCEAGNGYHVFWFQDGSGLKLDKNGMQLASATK
jgi:hypothetical protein